MKPLTGAAVVASAALGNCVLCKDSINRHQSFPTTFCRLTNLPRATKLGTNSYKYVVVYTYIVTRHQTPTPLYCSLYDLFMRHLKRPFTTLNAFTYEWSQLLLTHLHPEQHDCWQIPLDIHVCTWVGSRYSSRRKRGQTFRLVEPRANFLLGCCLKDWRHIRLGLEAWM